MSTPTPPPQWTPLNLLRPQFVANLAVLRARDPDLAARIEAVAPSEPHFIAAVDDRVTVARQVGSQLQTLPNPVSPVAAQEVVAKLFPGGACTEPVNVAGIDQGWIWDALYRLECKSPLPMHKPPLYLMANDARRLWVALHFQDWKAMLADPRVRLFVGPDAARQYRQTLVETPRLPLPRLSLTVEPAIWKAAEPALASADAVYKSVLQGWEARLRQSAAQVAEAYPFNAADDIARRIAAGESLRVLGITSRYTTFLQHSMRDWLAGLEALGHATRLVIEGADHEAMNNVVYLNDVVEFRPDLIVMIDHCRSEFGGLPAAVPCVMWVQDRLPNIFNATTGAAQGPRDFCLGFGRLHLSQNYGYPTRRFLPAPVGVNETRFTRGSAVGNDVPAHACETSFVSHHSTPADVLLTRQLEQVQQPEAKRLFRDVFDRLRAHYEEGGHVLVDAALRRIVGESAARLGLNVEPASVATIGEFFGQQVVNALFRQTALKWVADTGVDLHLYGRGWENHPTLKRYARGVADNASHLASIYRASKINLQITPFGAVHQRLLDGLSAGAFFLMRHSPGDEVGRHYRKLWEACVARRIAGDDHLRDRATTDAELAMLVANVLMLEGPDFAACGFKLYDVAAGHADGDFMVAASSVWPEYDRVAFRSPTDCAAMLHHFLANPDERRRVATSMRRTVVERASYTRISGRLLKLIGSELTATRQPRAGETIAA